MYVYQRVANARLNYLMKLQYLRNTHYILFTSTIKTLVCFCVFCTQLFESKEASDVIFLEIANASLLSTVLYHNKCI